MQCEPFLWEVQGGCFGRNGIFCIRREGEIITWSWQACCSFASGHLDLPVDDLDGQETPIWTHCSLNCARQACNRSTDPPRSAFSGTGRAHPAESQFRSISQTPDRSARQASVAAVVVLLCVRLCVVCLSVWCACVHVCLLRGAQVWTSACVCACMWKSATDSRSLLWFLSRLFIEAGSFPWT